MLKPSVLDQALSYTNVVNEVFKVKYFHSVVISSIIQILLLVCLFRFQENCNLKIENGGINQVTNGNIKIEKYGIGAIKYLQNGDMLTIIFWVILRDDNGYPEAYGILQ